MPFKFVEYEKIRSWMKCLNLDAMPISRNSVMANVSNIHEGEREA